jgi:hypothetical protein
LGRCIDFVREIEDTYEVKLLPAFMILVALYPSQVRKREEAAGRRLASAAAAAGSDCRARGDGAVIAFGQAIASRCTEESIKAARSHIFRSSPPSCAWALARSDGQWRPLMNVGDATPAAQESAAKIALCEIDRLPESSRSLRASR